MNRIHYILAPLLLTLLAPCQGNPRDGDLPMPAADVLLGTWICTGEDAERLEFRRDGLLLVDGVEVRYRIHGHGLTIETQGKPCAGVWRVVEPDLWITLRLDDGTWRTERYRREASRTTPVDQGARPAAPKGRARRAIAGAATFELPSGWDIARADARSALLDLGLREPDTLDALVIVTSGEVPEEARDISVVQLVRSHLREIATELVDLQVEIDPRTAVVRQVRLPDGSGAELTVDGTSGGEHPVKVWVGAIRNDTRYAGVIAVIVAGQEGRFLPGARSVLRTLEISAVALPTGGDIDRGTANLTGEFGYSTGGATSRTITYTFYANGNVTVHKMFSSPVGSHESTAHGTFTVRGDSVAMLIEGEVVEGAIEGSNAGIQALRIGGTRYARTR